MRMPQFGRGLDFAQEPVGAERGPEIGMQHLDGDVALVLEIVREVDGGHPAGTEFAVDAVAVPDCGGDALHVIAHDAGLRFLRSDAGAIALSRMARMRGSPMIGCRSGY